MPHPLEFRRRHDALDRLEQLALLHAHVVVQEVAERPQRFRRDVACGRLGSERAHEPVQLHVLAQDSLEHGVEPAWRTYSGNRISSSRRKCLTVSVKNASTYALATASRSSGPAPAARSKRLACASSWWCSSDSGTRAEWRLTVSLGPRRAARTPT
jgi:hypothetical protein